MIKEAHAVLPAADLARARAFYHDKLGMDAGEPQDGMIMFRPHPGVMFAIYETPNAGTAQNTQMCFITDSLDSDMAAMRANGVVFEEYDFPGMKTVGGVLDGEDTRTAWFKDSEGNYICVSETK